MKTTKFVMTAALAATLFFAGCKPKDADIQAAVQAKEASGINVAVAKGDVTLSGEVADEAAKLKAEEVAKAEKGVKSVINNITVKVEASVVISEDVTLQKNVADATKDFPTVKTEVKDGVVTLTGEIQKASLITLMQHLSALKPKKIDNKLTIK